MRWMQGTVKNLTQFRIEHVAGADFLHEGEFVQPPGDVPPLAQMTFSCRTKEGQITGCGGGTKFRIHLHDGSQLEFAIVSPGSSSTQRTLRTEHW